MHCRYNIQLKWNKFEWWNSVSIAYASLILLRNRRSVAAWRGSPLKVTNPSQTFAFISNLGHLAVSPGLGVWGHEDFTVLLAACFEVCQT